MNVIRRCRTAFVCALVMFCIAATAADTPVLRVAYAGSMGVVMDNAAGPAFAKTHNATYQGTGQGSYALAHLLAAHQMQADVFVTITPGPMQVLKQAGMVTQAVPVASTQMVISYSPHSRFAADFAAAAQGKKNWYDVLSEPGLHLGRTDPAIDPQGANALLTLQLAADYYHRPDMLQKIAGDPQNTAQIFTEPSLMSRLEAGQIDAAISYLSAAQSHHLPTINLPDEINLGNPAMQAPWYDRASITLSNGKTLKVQPLVFYAAVLSNAQQPQLARDFVTFLQSPEGQTMFRDHGYSAPRGSAL
ncbi:extracellular solute-binding protein [Dyella caseinilytica]|uniref:Extracellular solute-binding protein n=1 Tax=Dyella caseinilytica TaxID=1849581 RepID=A0ABX7GQR3_9GAMM|nr:extracellular solute-binding protein [Dyella caseinilytica]QRN52338.1 extracellular solute-binding protein [Dyella caseinilytica]GGA14932.1 tungstate ABC transporter substrate-binding protein WtpA [Dyella caseinilytica]